MRNAERGARSGVGCNNWPPIANATRAAAMLTFAELCASHFLDVHRFAFWLYGSPTEAGGMISETFIRDWTNIGRILTETVRDDVSRMDRNVYLRHVRKRRRGLVPADPLPNPQPGPEVIAEWREALAGEDSVLGRLSEQDRATFIMRVAHGPDRAEISRGPAMSEVAARAKVHRVRKALLEGRVRSEGER
jgi:DNA-directed RNA polymerase specialized sigma24 family protein